MFPVQPNQLINYSIPYLQFDRSLRNSYYFGSKLHTNSRVVVELKLFLQKLQQHATLAHAYIEMLVLVSPMTISLNRKAQLLIQYITKSAQIRPLKQQLVHNLIRNNTKLQFSPISRNQQTILFKIIIIQVFQLIRMSKYPINRTSQQPQTPALRKTQTQQSKANLTRTQLAERKSIDLQINPYLAEIDTKPTQKKRRQFDMSFNAPILIQQNRQLTVENREMSLLIHEKNRTIEVQEKRYLETIQHHNKVFKDVEADKQRFIGEVIRMKADTDSRMEQLEHNIITLQEDKLNMQREFQLNLKTCALRLNQDHQKDIDKLVQQYQQNIALANAETNKWKQQYEAKTNQIQIQQMQHKHQSDESIRQISKLKQDLKHLQQLKKLEQAELKNFYQSKLQKLHLENRREKQLFLVQHDSQVKRSQDECSRLREQIEQVKLKLQQKDLELSNLQVNDINYREKLQSQMDTEISSILAMSHSERTKYEQLLKTELVCLQVSGQRQVEHLREEYSRIIEICQIKNKQISKLYAEMTQLRQNHMQQLQNNQLLIGEFQSKIQTNQMLSSQQSQIIKVKLGVLRQADLEALKSYFEHQIQVLTERIHQKDTVIDLNRQRYQDQLMKKAEMRKQFELKGVQYREKIKSLQIQISNLKAQKSLEQEGQVVITEILQTKQVVEQKKKIKSQAIKTDECRQLQLIIDSKDLEIAELQNRINLLKGHHQEEIKQKDIDLLRWRQKYELAINQITNNKQNYEKELKKIKELLNQQKIQSETQLNSMDNQRKSQLDHYQQQLDNLNLQYEQQARRFHKDEKQLASKIKILEETIAHKERQVIVFKEQSHQTTVDHSRRQRQLLQEHYNQQLAIKQEQIQDLRQRISELSSDLRDSRQNYSELQKKLQQLIQSQSALRDIQKKVMNMGKQNNLTKNMKQCCR